jgi:hypothetical protein
MQPLIYHRADVDRLPGRGEWEIHLDLRLVEENAGFGHSHPPDGEDVQGGKGGG